MKYDFSILIPARNEEFLKLTVEDILRNKRGNTEILVGLDGWFTDIPTHPDVRVLHKEESIGQRAMTNRLCEMSEAKYVMKVDAHCAFDEGFDVKLMADMQDDWTCVPTMRNLHVFNWLCPNGHRRYMSPSGPCSDCGAPTTKEIIWKHRENLRNTSYLFDSEPHFQYFQEYKKKQIGDLVETMSLQGSCFMLTREKYWELDICDESMGSWGSQGIEVACKTWLSGGRVIVNKKTWYAHMFRTQGGDFGFPYPITGKQTEHAKQTAKKLFFDNRWPKQIYPLSWLVEKFDPPERYWSKEAREKLKAWPLPTRGVVYISDVRLDPKLLKTCQTQLRNAFKGRIVSVTLSPIDFGENIVLPLQREKLSIFKQILAGLEALDTDYVFLCDDDVLYSPSHFDFLPPKDDTFYYNLNWWRLRLTDGFSVHWDAKQSNLLCANRILLVNEYRERVRKVEAEGWKHGGYEPGTRSLKRGGFSDSPSGTWRSKEPCIDIRHGRNLTKDKWSKEDFRDPKYRVGWGERYDKSWKESNDLLEWYNLLK